MVTSGRVSVGRGVGLIRIIIIQFNNMYQHVQMVYNGNCSVRYFISNKLQYI